MMATIYELGSALGATVALGVFLCLSLAVSMGIYLLLVRRDSRRARLRDMPAIPAPFAALFSTAVFALLFGALYATTLQGFYRLELLGDEVRLHYLFPEHTVTLPRVELTQAERVPAHKGRWHLRLRTQQGTLYQSALANDRAVLESSEGVNAWLDGAGHP